MNLQPVTMRPGQTLQCKVCLRMVHEVWADLDGEAFVDYYCAEHKPQEKVTNMIIGTSHFVSIMAAEKYYEPYGYDSVRATVKWKLAQGEIHIGPPSVKKGERIILLDDGLRYGVVTK